MYASTTNPTQQPTNIKSQITIPTNPTQAKETTTVQTNKQATNLSNQYKTLTTN